MQHIRFTYHHAVKTETVSRYAEAVSRCQRMLDERTGPGSDFLGWTTLPADIRPQLDSIQATADLLRSRCDIQFRHRDSGDWLSIAGASARLID